MEKLRRLFAQPSASTGVLLFTAFCVVTALTSCGTTQINGRYVNDDDVTYCNTGTKGEHVFYSSRDYSCAYEAFSLQGIPEGAPFAYRACELATPEDGIVGLCEYAWVRFGQYNAVQQSSLIAKAAFAIESAANTARAFNTDRYEDIYENLFARSNFGENGDQTVGTKHGTDGTETIGYYESVALAIAARNPNVDTNLLVHLLRINCEKGAKSSCDILDNWSQQYDHKLAMKARPQYEADYRAFLDDRRARVARNQQIFADSDRTEQQAILAGIAGGLAASSASIAPPSSQGMLLPPPPPPPVSLSTRTTLGASSRVATGQQPPGKSQFVVTPYQPQLPPANDPLSQQPCGTAVPLPPPGQPPSAWKRLPDGSCVAVQGQPVPGGSNGGQPLGNNQGAAPSAGGSPSSVPGTATGSGGPPGNNPAASAIACLRLVPGQNSVGNTCSYQIQANVCYGGSCVVGAINPGGSMMLEGIMVGQTLTWAACRAPYYPYGAVGSSWVGTDGPFYCLE
jgi:hypothetical protein